MRMTQGAVDYRSTVDQKAGLQQQLPPGTQPPVQMPVPGLGQPGWYAPPPPAAGLVSRRSRRPDSPHSRPARTARPAAPAPAADGHPQPVHAQPAAPQPGARRRPPPDQARGRPMSTPQQPPTRAAAAGRARLAGGARPSCARLHLADPGRAHAPRARPRLRVDEDPVGALHDVDARRLPAARRRHRRCWSPRQTTDDDSGRRRRTPAPGFFGLLLGQICVITLGVLTIASEYGTGMIRTTFTACPQPRPGARREGDRLLRRRVRRVTHP